MLGVEEVANVDTARFKRLQFRVWGLKPTAPSVTGFGSKVLSLARNVPKHTVSSVCGFGFRGLEFRV